MVSFTTIITTIAFVSTTASAQEVFVKRCYCSQEDLSPNAKPIDERVNVDWTTQACADQGYMNDNACIVAADARREYDFMQDCLKLPGLATTGCIL
ncbi:hypothetical protein Cob_v012241 [Colletotrichum orbiculare MAFF 240422]|uniref:Uncharacterized protein n=1 Tax=Colletotrichum orbiculare (strain 104-T / ATCC 96160 / CBS 514.97 / LARS 414 / MAFF 240422) TaxID=1213857 RepID=A0A484FBE9_COLOR|nr:hypothetical protein Cob_v012241 [Colletotrichum orbiculare MAFF 240422]